MMFLLKFLVTSFVMISPVMASLVEEINRQLEIIEDSVNRNNLPNSTLLSTKNRLDKVIEGLSSQQGPGSSIGNLRCVAKDNDNRPPYIIGAVNPRTLAIVQIAGTTFKNLTECEKSIAASRRTHNSYHAICASKDNDGVSPWQYSILSDENKLFKVSTFKGLDECIGALQKTLITRFVIATCASKDNDGVAPYSKYIFSLENLTLTKQESYRDMNTCFASF